MSNPPPLLISPDLYLGITREIVDLLLEYAADPLHDKFRQKKVWSF